MRVRGEHFELNLMFFDWLSLFKLAPHNYIALTQKVLQ